MSSSRDNSPTLEFGSKNLFFRELRNKDAHDIFRIYKDPEVMGFDYSEPIKSMDDAIQLIERSKEFNKRSDHINWGVELVAEKRIIGTCGFKHWDRASKHAEIGGNLSSDMWGNGYGKEGLDALLHFGFVTLGLNKVCAGTNTENLKAINIMRAFGFKEDGRLREHQLLNGVYTDVRLYSLLRKEYSYN
ncbi:MULTISPECIES: GNAT family N-acetyltransferase [Bacillaceae]|uniref:GNAT family N-acetyltransferase n=1 Tax=Evansella alkalicola TaxID=745819 RepID=A0ABS6JSA8_9BACI|nr:MULTISPECIES: GNAT family protein [Bacillaceae]MBU9721451.1 GNAT family N-acetyltransferase [Bacillus alkalicola]